MYTYIYIYDIYIQICVCTYVYMKAYTSYRSSIHMQVVKRDGRALRYAPPVFHKDRDVPRATNGTGFIGPLNGILLGIHWYLPTKVDTS